MCLLLRFDLHAVFDATEKSIGVVQRQNFFAREQIELSQRVKCLEHVWFLQKRMTRTMDKLQGLHDEFDLANTAAPKFYVAFQLFGSDHVAFDAVLDVRDLCQQIGSCAFWVNERLMQSQKIICQLTTAGDSAGLDERNAFPRFAEAS